jgi:hypothetical protein
MAGRTALVADVDAVAKIKPTVLNIARHAVAGGSECDALDQFSRDHDPIRVEQHVGAVDEVHEISGHRWLLAIGGSARSLSHREAG